MALIGRINTIVSVTTAPFTKGMGNVANSITGLTRRFGPLMAGFTGVAGVAGMGLLVKSSFKTIDSLAKTADSVGLTTEALAGLRRAGERSGVETGKLDKAIARMQRTVSTAKDSLIQTERGTSGSARNFEMLGLSVDHIRSLAPEEQFFQIAEAIAKIPDQTDKTRLAMETFGRDGTSVLKILGKGADAARAELAKAAELGLAPSREDAAKIEEANDAMADMKDSFIGVANTIAITVAPTIKNIAERVTQFGIKARTAFVKVLPIVKQWGNHIKAQFNLVMSIGEKVFSFLGISGTTSFDTILDKAFDFFATTEYVFQNFGKFAKLGFFTALLGGIVFFEELKHTFTTRIPVILKWFFRNWKDIFHTIFDFTATVFINMGKNIRSAMKGIWDYIKSAGRKELKIVWTPLTEGFVNTIKELPDIPERAIGEIEKRFRDSVSEMAGDLQDGLAEHIAARRAELLDIKTPATEIKEKLDIGIDDTLSKKLDDLQGVAAVERGSSEAFSAIFKAMRGESQADKQLKTAEQQLKEQKQATAALKKIAANPPVQLVAGEV